MGVTGGTPFGFDVGARPGAGGAGIKVRLLGPAWVGQGRDMWRLLVALAGRGSQLKGQPVCQALACSNPCSRCCHTAGRRPGRARHARGWAAQAARAAKPRLRRPGACGAAAAAGGVRCSCLRPSHAPSLEEEGAHKYQRCACCAVPAVQGSGEIPPGATLDIDMELLSIKQDARGFQVSSPVAAGGRRRHRERHARWAERPSRGTHHTRPLASPHRPHACRSSWSRARARDCHVAPPVHTHTEGAAAVLRATLHRREP